jgi:WD40 repeat protein/tRNA A-37 threonylcarbamoyl transferase component Bud32
MPDAPESRDYGLLERLADEFAERHRRGERPTVEEYAERHPALADDLRELLPAMVELEKAQQVMVPEAPTPPAEGERLFGDFRILREIGRGGMGVVYEAEQLSLGRRVALKVLTQKMLTDAKQKRRFEREARAAAKLHHTNIVPVFGVGQNDGNPFYVMQFIHGMGLDQVVRELAGMAEKGKTTAAFRPADASRADASAAAVAVSLLTGHFRAADSPEADEAAAVQRTVTAPVRQNGDAPTGSLPSRASAEVPPAASSDSSAAHSSATLPGQSGGAKLSYWQSVARVGAQVADALDYAHKQGIVHRDIKPSNLLLDMAGTVWVADFGLAKADDQQDLTHTGDILGTLRYMPPEAFVGRVDARGDVYALGLTLYEMLALRPAFEERDRHKLIGLVTTSEPPPLLKLRPDVPRDLETVVHKAIDRDPARRYQTAAEFREDLQRFVNDEPIRARRQTTVEAAWRWARRHPGTAVLTALILLLMVGVTVGSLVAASYFDQLAKRAEETADLERDAREQAGKQQAAAEAAQKEADKQRHAAEERKREADRQRKDTERLVARQFVDAGSRLAADGDAAGALLWNVAAITADPEQADSVRTRFAMMLRQAPVPVHTLFHDSPISSFKIDPRGRTVAAVCENGAVVTHDLGTGKRLSTLHCNGAVGHLEFSRDGERLVTLSVAPEGDGIAPAPKWAADEVRVWSVRDGRPLTPLLPHVRAVRPGSGYDNLFSVAPVSVDQFFCLGDERIVACPDAKTCKLYDAATGKEVATVRETEKGSVGVGEVSADGKRLVLWEDVELPAREDTPFGGGVSRSAYVVDISDPQRPSRWEVKAPVDARRVQGTPQSVTFSPEGGFVLAAGPFGVRLYDVAGNKVEERFVQQSPNWSGGGYGYSSQPLFGRFSPGDRFLALYEARVRGGFGAPPPQETVVLDLQAKKEVKPQVLVSFGTIPILALDLRVGKEVKLPAVRSAIEFGPRGQFLLARTAERPVIVNAETGGEVSQLPADARGTVRLSPDGQYVLLTQGDTAIRIYHATTGQRALPWLPHESPVNQAAFTPDGSRVVTAAGTSLRVWPLDPRDESARRIDLGQNGPGTSNFLSPDGSRLVAVSPDLNGGEYVCRVWDTTTAKPLSNPAAIPGIAPFNGGKSGGKGGFGSNPPTTGPFDPAGEWVLLTGSQRGAPYLDGVGSRWVVHVPTGELTAWPLEATATTGLYWEIAGPDPAWSPAGSYLLRTKEYVSGRYVRENVYGGGNVGTWFDPGSLFYPPRPKSAVEILDPKGKPAAPALHFPGAVSATWAPDGKHLAVISGRGELLEVSLWRFEPGKPLEKVRGLPPLITAGATWEVFSTARYAGTSSYTTPWMSFSADGRRLMFALARGSRHDVRIWDVASGDAAGAVMQLDGISPGSFRASRQDSRIGPDGATLFAVGVQQKNRGVRVIDVVTGKDRVPMMVPTEALQGFAVSPDGKRVLTYGANTVQLWDVQTGELLTTPLMHESGLSFATFTADGRRVISRTGGFFDTDPGGGGPRGSGDVRIWDAATGQPLLPGLGPSSDIQWDRYGTRLLRTTFFGTFVHDLAPDTRPVEELRELAETLAARRVSGGGGLVVLDAARIREGWAKTAPARTGWGTAATGKAWHADQIAQRGGAGGFVTGPGGAPGSRFAAVTIPATALRWHLDEFLKLDPADRTYRLQRAQLAYRGGEWKQAIADFTDIPGGPINRSYLMLRGNSYAELGQWEEARRDFRAYADFLNNPDNQPKGAPPTVGAAQRLSGAAQRALVELRLGNRAEFKRITEEAERELPNPTEGFASALARNAPQLLWPSLLLNEPPPKALAALYERQPEDAPPNPGGPPGGFGSGRIANLPFPVAAGVAYRQGNTGYVVNTLERRFNSEQGCAASECFLLAMAAKKEGNDALADQALARGIKLMADPAKEPPPPEGTRAGPGGFGGGPGGPGASISLTWQKRLVNDTLRHEAEEVVRGKKP